jgi:hypothetical protein
VEHRVVLIVVILGEVVEIPSIHPVKGLIVVVWSSIKEYPTEEESYHDKNAIGDPLWCGKKALP